MGIYNDYNNNSTSIPQTVIIDLDGYVRYAKLGTFGSAGAVIDIINELI